MSARPVTCYKPNPQFTGRCQWQPRPDQTQNGWYIDSHANYTEAGFLDAPEQLPSGSVRGIDIGAVRLMSSAVDRDTQCFWGPAKAAVAALAIALLTACGGTDDDDSTQQAPNCAATPTAPAC